MRVGQLGCEAFVWIVFVSSVLLSLTFSSSSKDVHGCGYRYHFGGISVAGYECKRFQLQTHFLIDQRRTFPCAPSFMIRWLLKPIHLHSVYLELANYHPLSNPSASSHITSMNRKPGSLHCHKSLHIQFACYAIADKSYTPSLILKTPAQYRTIISQSINAKYIDRFKLQVGLTASLYHSEETLFPFTSLTAPNLFPATAPANIPGKFATIKPIAPPLNPPIRLQNFPVGLPLFSAIPSSFNISSNTSPNCSSSNFFSSSAFFAFDENPKLDHGNPPGTADGSGISSSSSMDVEAVEAPDPKPWYIRAASYSLRRDGSERV
ncbi:hypothetical protein EYC80_005825 [Monilinia laxa]|uniref:Uncharacterized protein n=1 Tax=Monilinia laxa TaxID=61186 RepID=A0A5N6KFE5_MONLA|nr:hypothetical protein EYC80_005825 [Monilinia laxa]